ncbi:MAG: hypothetical protein IKK27_04165 [Alistipes sp.]|nr:hypothetical protein [Alistipes sp.]
MTNYCYITSSIATHHTATTMLCAISTIITTIITTTITTTTTTITPVGV